MAGYLDFGMAVTAPDRDEVRQASLRLPERQRDALELREGKGLSYEQIAATLGTGAGSVAQLLERARINLYDELRGTALASIAAPSPECERALPLIAARQDRELASSSEDAAWLDAHLDGCDRCRLAAEQMSDASALLRGEAPPTVVAAAAAVQPTPTAAEDAAPDPLERSRGRHPSRRMTLAGGLAALALGGVAIALMADGGSRDAVPPAADAAARRNAAAGIAHARVVRAAYKARTARHTRKGAKSGTDAAGLAPIQTGGSVTTPLYTPTQGSSGGSGGAPASSHHASGGDAAVHPAKQKSTANPAAKPKSPSSSAQPSQPAAQPASEAAPPPAEEPTPPAEEPIAEHGHKGEPPGKPADRPPHK